MTLTTPTSSASSSKETATSTQMGHSDPGTQKSPGKLAGASGGVETPATATSDLTAQLEKWKATGIHHRVQVTGSNGKVTEGDVYVENWDQKARMARALKALGLCLGGACVAILIPLVHFILVPALLITAPIAAWTVYQQDAVVLGGLSSCPKCGAPLPIVRGKVSWPLKDVCGKCYENVKIDEI